MFQLNIFGGKSLKFTSWLSRLRMYKDRFLRVKMTRKLVNVKCPGMGVRIDPWTTQGRVRLKRTIFWLVFGPREWEDFRDIQLGNITIDLIPVSTLKHQNQF